jgi:tetratricopeptide (TPR) repeat protein
LGFCSATDLNPPDLQEKVRSAFDCGYRQEYDSARSLVDELIADYPDNPAGHFFMGALWQLYIFDTRSDSMGPTFLGEMQKAQDKAEAILKHEDNAWAHLYLGAANSFRSLYYGLQGRYWDAFTNGIEAPPELHRALRCDSSVVDAWLGLGLTEYFGSQVGRYLGGISSFGSVDRGIEEINRTASGGGYFANTARYSLVWILAHERRFHEAYDQMARLRAKYPDNRMFRRLSRDIYRAGGEYDSAILLGNSLGSEIAQVQPTNVYALTENQYALALCCFGRGDTATARIYCDSVISHEPQEQEVPKLAHFIRAARALRSK